MIEIVKKYYFLLFLGVLFGQNANPETGWDYTQTTAQCFYMFETINIDGNAAVGDGGIYTTSDECLQNFNTCDVIGAFIERDEIELNEDINEFKTLLPTTENICKVILDRLKPTLKERLYEIKVQETENIIATSMGQNYLKGNIHLIAKLKV